MRREPIQSTYNREVQDAQRRKQNETTDALLQKQRYARFDLIVYVHFVNLNTLSVSVIPMVIHTIRKGKWCHTRARKYRTYDLNFSRFYLCELVAS